MGRRLPAPTLWEPRTPPAPLAWAADRRPRRGQRRRETRQFMPKIVKSIRSSSRFARAVKPSLVVQRTDNRAMKIRSHSESHIVELDDGSAWRVYPGDIDVTLNWQP